MKSGFTIIRNGEKLGYPYLEAIASLAPVVDELVVAVGNSEDKTREKLEILAQNSPTPIRLFDSPWDDANTKMGSELARQTNIALDRCQGDICFYIQADECLHDEDYPILIEDMKKLQEDPELDCILLRWEHFYGNFNTVVRSKQWYRREIRIIKKSRGLKSFGDAQGFRIQKDDGSWVKPRAALSKARMFHYGWVRPPKTMAEKSQALDRFWHGNKRDGQHTEENVYPPRLGMRKYRGSHPKLMRSRIEAFGEFDPFEGKKPKRNLRYYRHKLSDLIEESTGWRPGEYRNYKLLKEL